MKLQPYAQTTIAKRSNQKLGFKFFGPYEVLARVGKVAYKLKLPPGSQIHPVLHVSQLKKSVPANQVIDSDLSSQFLTDECFLVEPLALTGRRTIKRGRGFVEQIQVSWTGLPDGLKTWESEAALRHRFPGAAAWGQAPFQGGAPAMIPGPRRHRKRDIRRALGRQPSDSTTQAKEADNAPVLTELGKG
jgi:hypothetical protein